ncbi:MAG: GNAT family N-acetyltransferase [Oscillospiraceae bacterium]|nr:GNAT family N-acetyltransferase [Oscillospiraceae bacterium]
MELLVKSFAELSTRELYDLLRLRVDVFVVEQRCPYPELDGWDQAALHVWLQDDTGIQAYLRIMDRGVSGEYVTIGRVIAVKRRQGLGSRILAEGVRLARERFGAEQIYLEAQVYARTLYEKQGFRAISGPFLEDGIPHVKMLLDLTGST